MAQGLPIPDDVKNEAIKGFNEGGYKATTVLACVGLAVLGGFIIYLFKRQDKREDQFSTQLAARDATIVKLAEKLEAVSTRATDIAARGEEAVEASTRVMESAKEVLTVVRDKLAKLVN